MSTSGEPARSGGRWAKKVAFTMIPVKDVARARSFYEQVLELPLGMHGGAAGVFWVEYDLPGGGCLAVTNATGAVPSAGGATVALEVHDLKALLEHLRSSGATIAGDIVRGPRCRMATVLDPDGNGIVLHQLDAPT